MPTLHDHITSGNGYKVRLLLAHRKIPHSRVEYDIDRGETRTPAFLARNPNGRVPLLELDDGTCLAESNAILFYLATDTDWLPGDRLAIAQALQWMFFEQYSHEPYIAVVRYWITHNVLTPEREMQLSTKRDGGYAALGVMERHLGDRDWFVGSAPTIADIALYAYTHVAGEGGFDLAPYSAVRAWLDRFASLPGHIPITQG